MDGLKVTDTFYVTDSEGNVSVVSLFPSPAQIHPLQASFRSPIVSREENAYVAKKKGHLAIYFPQKLPHALPAYTLW